MKYEIKALQKTYTENVLIELVFSVAVTYNGITKKTSKFLDENELEEYKKDNSTLNKLIEELVVQVYEDIKNSNKIETEQIENNFVLDEKDIDKIKDRIKKKEENELKSKKIKLGGKSDGDR